MSRTFGLFPADFATTDRYRYASHSITAPLNWGVLELDGRRYLINEDFTEAVPAGDRGPGAYGWTRQTGRNPRPNSRKWAKVLARVLKARLKNLQKVG
jgi:hypothetical protein